MGSDWVWSVSLAARSEEAEPRAEEWGGFSSTRGQFSGASYALYGARQPAARGETAKLERSARAAARTRAWARRWKETQRQAQTLPSIQRLLSISARESPKQAPSLSSVQRARRPI
ncbi:MAG: hypothetical protein AMXMBFR33_03100 [Candidatus Xenobia bacterium]